MIYPHLPKIRMYVLGDVSYEGYKVKKAGGSDSDIKWTVAERATF
jgi:hypothetical protein